MRKTWSALRHPALAAGMILIIVAFIVSQTPGDRASSRLLQDFEGPFDLSAARSPQVQYFRMETQFVHIGFDGKRTGFEIYTLKLKCVPASLSGREADEYTCREFTFQVDDGSVLTIPSLAGWSYRPSLSGAGRDEIRGLPCR